MGARRRSAPDDPVQVAEAILADPRVIWFPVRHYSPACAMHAAQMIRAIRPAAVLVEGPDDATDLIPFIIHAETRPPITILSSYVDSKNKFGMNGVLSSSPAVPARYRGWWPLVEYSPEYAALRAGAEVGAQLAFIDAPLPATIPYTHAGPARRSQALDDRHLAESRWFRALARRGGHRTFDAFWDGLFEAGGTGVEADTFRRSVLIFAWCARHIHDEAEGAPGPSLELDGTVVREAHMRWHIDRALKATEGPIFVLTGAFHTVALPWTRAKRAPGRPDRYSRTLLTPHSFRALAKLYDMNRMPAYGQAVAEAIAEGAAHPLTTAAQRLGVEVVREARAQGVAVSTADGVAALHHAAGLAQLRGFAQITREDLLDSLQATLIKGASELAGGPIEAAARKVLIGDRVGTLTPEAGQAPLTRDLYETAKRHRIDLTGASTTVRLDLRRREPHRLKSAFLHRCAFLDIPLFGTLQGAEWQDFPYFRGPDPVEGTDLHLLGETWAIRWREEVDDRLLELSDRGPTLGAVATAKLAEELPAARGDVAAATRLLVQAARMWLVEWVEDAMEAVEQALARDGSFSHLVGALTGLVLLHSYREVLPTAGDPRVAQLVAEAHRRACLAIPLLDAVAPDDTAQVLDELQAVVRLTLTFDAVALDRELLVDRVRQLAGSLNTEPAVRGAAFGILYSFGAVRQRAVADALAGYLASTAEHARGAGGFLDGLFLTGRILFLRSQPLLEAVDRVLQALPWEVFKEVLPDLRRAFTRFVPAELDEIAGRVGRTLGTVDPGPSARPLTGAEREWARALDARIADRLQAWLGEEEGDPAPPEGQQG